MIRMNLCVILKTLLPWLILNDSRKINHHVQRFLRKSSRKYEPNTHEQPKTSFNQMSAFSKIQNNLHMTGTKPLQLNCKTTVGYVIQTLAKGRCCSFERRWNVGLIQSKWRKKAENEFTKIQSDFKDTLHPFLVQ